MKESARELFLLFTRVSPHIFAHHRPAGDRCPHQPVVVAVRSAGHRSAFAPAAARRPALARHRSSGARYLLAPAGGDPRIAWLGNGLPTAGAGAGAHRRRQRRAYRRPRRSGHHARRGYVYDLPDLNPLFLYGRGTGNRADQRDYRHRPVALGVVCADGAQPDDLPAPARVCARRAAFRRGPYSGIYRPSCRCGAPLAAGAGDPGYRAYDAARRRDVVSRPRRHRAHRRMGSDD